MKIYDFLKFYILFRISIVTLSLNPLQFRKNIYFYALFQYKNQNSQLRINLIHPIGCLTVDVVWVTMRQFVVYNETLIVYSIIIAVVIESFQYFGQL